MARVEELRGQARVIGEIRRMVDAWRGFELGRAEDAFPPTAPRYQPAADGERPVSEVTLSLLNHWFRSEPHILERVGTNYSFRYWPHQRRLAETFIYLYEARGIRRTEELYELTGVEPLGPQRDPWAKLGGNLATGSGKTKMMSLLIAWSYLNAAADPDNPLGFGGQAVVIAPNLFVRDRLLQDFCPPYERPSVFVTDPVVPPELDSLWRLKVYTPLTCPLRLDPREGALVVTNYHQLLRTGEDLPAPATAAERQIDLLFGGGDPDRLEAVSTPLLERFRDCRGLVVLNDEAHHVWDETGHSKFEEKARQKATVAGDKDAQTAMAWIRSIRRLNGDENQPGRVAFQADLSATLFEEAGSKEKAGKGKGARAEREFKQAELFRHAVVNYELAEAIRDGIVKKPILERVEVINQKTKEPEPLIREGQPNAWEKYRNLLITGIERWRKVKEQLADEGDPRKPILFILTDDRHEAREVANYLRFGEAVRDDLPGRPVTGFVAREGEAPLFVEPDASGVPQSTIVEIHIGEKEERNEEEWEAARQKINAIDLDEIPKTDADGRPVKDDEGHPIMVPNPYNVVVSVMMLKEGWDVRNVKVIVPLRPCDSRTLTEQTLGRGLRKMHAPIIEDDGAALLKAEDLFVIEHPSFKAILDKIQDIVEERSSNEIDHAREYVPVLQKADLSERQARGVRLVRFEGLREVVPDWRQHFDVKAIVALTPKLPWLEEIGDLEIRTFLKAALEMKEEEGQSFLVPEAPSYRDFDHVIEVAYAAPMLREMRTSFQHKNAVKGVVREFLEQKTFALPMGLPLSFDRAIEAGHGKIALGNLARVEVIQKVRQALLPELSRAITTERSTREAQLSERNTADGRGYQALKKNVLDCPRRSSFDRAAFDSADELRVARLLDQATDVVAWVFNHRSGIGYSIEYDWQGLTARYFPDFIVRARVGEVVHNFIIEVKGAYDDRDRAKALRGQRYCELLTEHDKEPWHYILLLENDPMGRADISWWEQQSRKELGHLLKRQESLPLLPNASAAPRPRREVQIEADVPVGIRFREALPVHDLAVAAGTFGSSQVPEAIGWVRVQAERELDRRMFVARVRGKSMEPAIPDGAWAIFRLFAGGVMPSPTALDGRRVVVELRGEEDPELGGAYTLKRWRVTKFAPEGGVVELTLMPDNPDFKPIRLRQEDGEVRAIAEFVEVVG